MLRERIRDLRRELKITQAELAERLSVHLQTVSKWERGISEPDISQLGELSVALSVSIERLCGLPEDSETYAGSFSTESLGESISRLRTQRKPGRIGRGVEQFGGCRIALGTRHYVAQCRTACCSCHISVFLFPAFIMDSKSLTKGRLSFVP